MSSEQNMAAKHAVNEGNRPAAKSQFALLGQRRYGPFFLTQLAGAFNDSFLKQLAILLVTFHAAEYTSLSGGLVANLAAGLFILPFVLFSAFAGKLADRYDKSIVIRGVKLAEVGIMVIASAGFYMKSLPLLLASIFLMGCHSAFFGPAKYSLLPCVLSKDELSPHRFRAEQAIWLHEVRDCRSVDSHQGRRL